MIKDVYVASRARRAAAPIRCSASTRRRDSSSRWSGPRRSRRAQQSRPRLEPARAALASGTTMVDPLDAGVGRGTRCRRSWCPTPMLLVNAARRRPQPACAALCDAAGDVLHRPAARSRLHRRARCCRRSRSSTSAPPATTRLPARGREHRRPRRRSTRSQPAFAPDRRRRWTPARICSRSGCRSSDRSRQRCGGSRPSLTARPARASTAADRRVRRTQATIDAGTTTCIRESRTGVDRAAAAAADADRKAHRTRRRSRRATRSARPAAAPQWRLLVKHPSGSLEAAVDAASPPQPDRQLQHPRAARRQRRVPGASRRGARRTWRGSRWSSSPPCRTSCARRSR